MSRKRAAKSEERGQSGVNTSGGKEIRVGMANEWEMGYDDKRATYGKSRLADLY
jgi:hypothetical protein